MITCLRMGRQYKVDTAGYQVDEKLLGESGRVVQENALDISEQKSPELLVRVKRVK